MGGFSHRHLRRMGEGGRGGVFRAAVRCYPGELDGGAAGHLYAGTNLRTRGGNRMERGCVCLRPLCVSAIPTGQPAGEVAGGDDVQPETTGVRTGETDGIAASVPGVPMAVCLQRGMPEEPLRTNGGRGEGAELSLQRLSPFL